MSISICVSLSLSLSVRVSMYISRDCQHPTACDPPTHLPCTVLGYRSPYPAASRRAIWDGQAASQMILIDQLCQENLEPQVWKYLIGRNTPGPQGPTVCRRGTTFRRDLFHPRVLVKSRLRPPTSRPQWCSESHWVNSPGTRSSPWRRLLSRPVSQLIADGFLKNISGC